MTRSSSLFRPSPTASGAMVATYHARLSPASGLRREAKGLPAAHIKENWQLLSPGTSLSPGALDLKGYTKSSGVGVSKVIVALAPGAMGAIVEFDGKHAVDGHPAGKFG